MTGDIGIYLNIIREGILNIRLISKKEDFHNIYTEINHIFNIPNIVNQYNITSRYTLYLHDKYLYQDKSCDNLKQSFEDYWDELDKIRSFVSEDTKPIDNYLPILINKDGLILDGISRFRQNLDIFDFEVLRFKSKFKFSSEMYIQNYGYDIDKIIKKQLFFKLLKQGIVNMRLSCINKDFEQVYCESNHIHNIINLIKNFDNEKEMYYKKVEKKQFLRESKREYVSYYKEIWGHM